MPDHFCECRNRMATNEECFGCELEGTSDDPPPCPDCKGKETIELIRNGVATTVPCLRCDGLGFELDSIPEGRP
jgi:DnaJ-class molecular chaperone